MKVPARLLLLWPALLIASTACRHPQREKRASDTTADAAVAVQDRGATLDLTVGTQNGVSTLSLRYPDRPGRVPIIVSISIGKRGATEVFCELDAVRLDRTLITGYWTVGQIPENYRAQGCRESALSPGDYEVALFTDRGEFRRRIHLPAAGPPVILPWEDR